MHLRAVETMLRGRIGFGPYPNGTLARCVGRRMQATGIDDESAYLSYLFLCPAEQEELIEEIVVPETWFFRDYEPFVFLQNHAVRQFWSRAPDNPMRVLSVPASTGEEAYSIAIALMEAGFSPERFRIDGVDVSGRALRKAAEGLYGAASFREKDFGLRSKYFEETGSMFHVCPEVSGSVSFSQGNVLDETSLGRAESYDIIFFRNLLIYLDEESRQLAIRNVERVLKKGGLLVRGYAEPQKVFFPEHIPVDHVRAHACLKPFEKTAEPSKSGPPKGASGTQVSPAAGGTRFPRKTGEAPGRRSARAQPGPPEKRTETGEHRKSAGATMEYAQAPPGDISIILDKARELADLGNHAAAEILAIECLKSDAACVDAHYLLATTALAQGDEAMARTHLNRVVYLDPAHRDGLLHLSLLMDRCGHKDQAERYRKRITRAKEAPGL
ncbi:MAG: methyltransferase domain-containing protein [Desulfobacteraceae bacterium]|nr:methyltransferase domain-containing protein [Desulfobacteraceae bacterium]